MELNDFKVGDKIIITGRNITGYHANSARVTAVNFNNLGLVTFEGYHDGEHMPSGAGAFNPAKIGTAPFGFYMKVEIV